MINSRLCAVFCLVLAGSGCAGRQTPLPASPVPGPPPIVSADPGTAPMAARVLDSEQKPLWQETGIASWYGREFHGLKTASGELFDMYALSAAHRTLPLGSAVVVTNLENSRSVKLSINDRGPFVGDRVLEVSYGAARELGFVPQGTARVRIESREQQVPSSFTVQAAVFAGEESARLLKERLSVKYVSVWTVPFESYLGKFYRVFVGSYHTEKKAEAIAKKLRLEGLEPFVVRKD